MAETPPAWIGRPPSPDEPAATLVIGQLKAVDTSEASSALDKRKTTIGAIVTVVVLVIIFAGSSPSSAATPTPGPRSRG